MLRPIGPIKFGLGEVCGNSILWSQRRKAASKRTTASRLTQPEAERERLLAAMQQVRTTPRKPKQ